MVEKRIPTEKREGKTRTGRRAREKYRRGRYPRIVFAVCTYAKVVYSGVMAIVVARTPPCGWRNASPHTALTDEIWLCRVPSASYLIMYYRYLYTAGSDLATSKIEVASVCPMSRTVDVFCRGAFECENHDRGCECIQMVARGSGKMKCEKNMRRAWEKCKDLCC